MLKLRLAGVALLTLLSATVTAFGQNAPADTSRPVALVIGNGSYPQSPVDSVPGDARAFADVLRDGGFDVVFAENAKRTEIEAAISAFTRKLGWGVTAVVYYGGHAVQYQDRNFLLAIDSKIASEADVRTEGIDIDLILDPLIVSRSGRLCCDSRCRAKKSLAANRVGPRPRSFQSTADPGGDGNLSGSAGRGRRRTQREPVRH